MIKGKLVWEFGIILSEETTCRRPDLIWKEKEKKKHPGLRYSIPATEKKKKKKKKGKTDHIHKRCL